LVRAINHILPEGYLVVPERSFQIRALYASYIEEIDPSKPQTRKPDVTVYDTSPTTAHPARSSPMTTMPSVTFAALDTIDITEQYLGAASIRAIENDAIGKRVAWFELLSPTNKPYRSGYFQYREKRREALTSRIVFVEMDYLHQSPPVINLLPSYPQAQSYPYYIALNDPRPTPEDGITSVYGTVVDQPLPTISIALTDKDTITLDFEAIYNDGFESANFYSHLVDYSQEPPRMNTYRADDQARIRARMAAVIDSPKSK
jgi:Protein of unknown function (DUF4058)